jgi:hypothetical protein
VGPFTVITDGASGVASLGAVDVDGAGVERGPVIRVGVRWPTTTRTGRSGGAVRELVDQREPVRPRRGDLQQKRPSQRAVFGRCSTRARAAATDCSAKSWWSGCGSAVTGQRVAAAGDVAGSPWEPPGEVGRRGLGRVGESRPAEARREGGRGASWSTLVVHFCPVPATASEGQRCRVPAAPEPRMGSGIPVPERRGRDSNPRYALTTHNGFRDRRIQPLCHLSVVGKC